MVLLCVTSGEIETFLKATLAKVGAFSECCIRTGWYVSWLIGTTNFAEM